MDVYFVAVARLLCPTLSLIQTIRLSFSPRVLSNVSNACHHAAVFPT